MCTTRHVVLAVLSAAALILVGLTALGPPPPSSQDVFYQPAPPVPRFILGDAAYAAWDEAADGLWDAVLPATGGAVLATNLTSGFHFWGRVSMFHQLACLRDIRTQLLRMARSPDEAKRFVDHRGPGSSYEALGYCFDYVLQGILCHADVTMNPVAVLNEEDRIIDGNALWHQCYDSSALVAWAETSGIPRWDPLVRERPHAAAS